MTEPTRKHIIIFLIKTIGRICKPFQFHKNKHWTCHVGIYQYICFSVRLSGTRVKFICQQIHLIATLVIPLFMSPITSLNKLVISLIKDTITGKSLDRRFSECIGVILQNITTPFLSGMIFLISRYVGVFWKWLHIIFPLYYILWSWFFRNTIRHK